MRQVASQQGGLPLSLSYCLSHPFSPSKISLSLGKMDSPNQSASSSLTLLTSYATPPIAASDATSPTAGSSAEHQSLDHMGNQTRSAPRSLASTLRQQGGSKYCIQYFETGVYNSLHSPSNLDGDKSQMKAHNEAMRILVSDLNRNSALDRNYPDGDVGAMVRLYNKNHKKTHVSVYDAESHSGERPVWDVLVSIKSVSVAHSTANEVVGKLSSGIEQASRVWRGLRRRGFEQL